MKRIIFIIILIFSLQSLSKADDISDFEIEGMSVGDSLLNFGNKKKIESFKSSKQYKSKYRIYSAEKLIETSIYDYMNVTTKNNDKDYIITSVSGIINYEKLETCLDKQKEISNEIEKIINYDEKQDRVFPSQRDKTGNSKVHNIAYYLKPYPSNENISVDCYHFTVESDIQRTLKVSAKSENFAKFLIDEAYK